MPSIKTNLSIRALSLRIWYSILLFYHEIKKIARELKLFEKRFNFLLKHPYKRLLFFLELTIIIKLSIELLVWWNWQTRWTQNPVVVIPCGFNSHHQHHSQRRLNRKVWFTFFLFSKVKRQEFKFLPFEKRIWVRYLGKFKRKS